LNATLKKIQALGDAYVFEAQQRLDALTKPRGSLGKLEHLALRIAVIQKQVPPRIGRKILFVFAADHGITEESVSAYPKEVTAQMTQNFLRGEAAINVLARQYGVRVSVVDVGVDYDFSPVRDLINCKIRRGTSNFAHQSAMTRDEAVRSVEAGIRLASEAAKENVFLLAAGDMGIGNTTSATAILCALTGATPRTVTGRGTGIEDSTLERKIAVIARGLEHNAPNPADAIDVLAKVGGFEIGAIAGVILGRPRRECR
jgi:nicotinate-nucleotide--dimethylbenzimidazole phosphoribosyltransferase